MAIEEILETDNIEELTEALNVYIDENYQNYAAAFIHRAYMLGVSNQSKNQ